MKERRICVDSSQTQSLHSLENCQWSEKNVDIPKISATNRCGVSVCNPTTQKAEAGNCCEFEANWGYSVSSKLVLRQCWQPGPCYTSQAGFRIPIVSCLSLPSVSCLSLPSVRIAGMNHHTTMPSVQFIPLLCLNSQVLRVNIRHL